MGPLVGKILRYYTRSPQVRYIYPIVVFCMLLTIIDPPRSFIIALGLINIIGSMSMGALPLNVFGFDGAGFRRYLLLPIPPAKVLYATALVPLIFGAATMPVSLTIWLVLAPIHIEALMIVMLIAFMTKELLHNRKYVSRNCQQCIWHLQENYEAHNRDYKYVYTP